MSDEIPPPMPTNSTGGPSRDSVNRDQGRGFELTSTVVTHEGKLGIILNKQFVPLTIALDAKVGDLVRVRVEQVGKESSARVLRILEAPQVTAPSPPVSARSLRDLFPPAAIRPLQELYSSLQEVLDQPQVRDAPPSHGQTKPKNLRQESLSIGILETELPSAGPEDTNGSGRAPLPSRHYPIPPAYRIEPTPQHTTSTAETFRSVATLPAPGPKPPSSGYAHALLSSLSATLPESPLGTANSSSSRKIIATVLEGAIRRIDIVSLPREGEPRGASPRVGHQSATADRQTRRISEPVTQPEQDSAVIAQTVQVPSHADQSRALRFHQAVTGAQPLLERYSRLFESLNQPSYLLTSLVIGSHLVPIELSTLRDPPPADRVDDEEGGRAPARRAFHRVRITVHLTTLGSVGIDLAYRESEVLLKFTSPSAHVVEFLSKELPLFAKELESQGFTLTSWFTERAGPTAIAPGWFQELVAGDTVA